MKPARIVFPGFWFGESELAEAKAQAARGVGGFCVYGGPAEQISQRPGVDEVGVQVLRSGADNAGVEHGVDVVRTAFERGDTQSAVDQGLQEAAGDQSLPAAAGGRGDHEPRKAHLPLTTAM